MLNLVVLVCLFLLGLSISVFLRKKTGSAFVLGRMDLESVLPLRGLLALFVILGHLDTATAYSSRVLAFLHLGTPAVAVFFFLTGYGLVKSYQIKGRGYLESLIQRSFVKLFVPWLTAALMYSAYLLSRGFTSFLDRIDMFVHHGYNFPPHSWYVFVVFLAYIGFAFAFRCKNDFNRIGVFAVMVVSYCLICRYVLHWRFYMYTTELSLVVGALWALKEEEIRQILPRIAGWDCLLIASAMMVLYLSIVHLRIAFTSLGNLVYCFLGPISALGVYYMNVKFVEPFAMLRKEFAFLGVISFELYLNHGVVYEMFIRLSSNVVLYVFLVIIVAGCVSFGLHRLNQSVIRIFQH